MCWTIPGMIIGGQIRPRLQGKISQHTMEKAMEKAIAILFGIIGLAMAWIAYHALML